MPLEPFLLGAAPTVGPLAAACPLPGAHVWDALDDSALAPFRLVNAGNALAFGGIAMPAWVQLDCCVLPSAMIGFALPRAELPPGLFDALAQQVGAIFGADAQKALDRWRGPVPISEYTALPTTTPGTVVGMSLFSLVRGRRIGTRTKALALACHGARRQIGVTQYGSPSLATHTAFGPLEILTARAAAHTRADDTFVYALDLAPDRTAALLGEQAPAPTPAADSEALPVGPEIARAVAERLARGPLAVVAPGISWADGRALLHVARR